MNRINITVIEGSERYRIIDLVTQKDSFCDDKAEAYRYAGYFISLGHEVRLEERDARGNILNIWDSRAPVA